jgi:4'-phosphopantetheinyl transferase
MRFEANEVHIWSTDLALTAEQLKEFSSLLSPDELAKAKRFRFDMHRESYIIARGYLRKILALYLTTAPEKIQISYDENDKPYVKDQALQFNLSHSKNKALYAFDLNHPLGIDIEFITDTYNPDVAARFFSPDENQAIELLPVSERTKCFYQFWARKEALIKAIGKGLTIPLHQFNVLMKSIPDLIPLEGKEWHLYPLEIHEHYACALATAIEVSKITQWQLLEDSPTLLKNLHLMI